MADFKTSSIYDPQIQKAQRITPVGFAAVEEATRLIGTLFGAAIDAQFWSVTNNGTASASGVASSLATLTSGTSNSGHGSITTVRTARFLFVNPNLCRIAARVTATGVADNTRRWGAYNASAANPPVIADGFTFEYTASTFSVCRYVGGSQTKVDSGSFNGATGTGANGTYTLDANVHAYEIIYFVMGAWFFIDGVLIHKFTPTTAILSSSLDLKVGAGSVNSGSGTTTATLQLWAGSIFRFGKYETTPKYFHGTTAASTQLKVGAGIFHEIVLNNAGGTLITIYDGVGVTANIIAIINTPATANATELNFDVPYETGLYIVTTGTWDFTLLYE